jgi:hypothetical protein
VGGHGVRRHLLRGETIDMKRNEVFLPMLEMATASVLVYFAVDATLTLKVFLAMMLFGILHLWTREREQRLLFSIADAELVRVSAIAGRLEEQVRTAEESIEDLRRELAEVRR